MTPCHLGPFVEVNLGALRENYRLLARAIGNTAMSAVVKCDAYGLGAAAISAWISLRVQKQG